jgi:hypothetical protein
MGSFVNRDASSERIEILGEIRSTIDLMMERTAGMSLSSKEKEEYRQEEFRKRARGLKIRLLEDPSQVDVILSSLGSESDEDRGLLEQLLWEEFVDSISVDQSALKALDVMAELPAGQAHRDQLDSLRDQLKTVLKTRTKDRKTVLARERKKLASFGISGTAVIPKIPADPPANSELASKIEHIKSQLHALPGL